MDDAQVFDLITRSYPQTVRDESHTAEQLHIIVPLGLLPDVMRFLRDNHSLAYTMLTDLTAVDYPSRTPRFDLIYILYSLELKHRLVVKAFIQDGEKAPTMTHLWASADWAERETYDLLGIEFAEHPDLRRILTWDNFEGHPLRKEFPLTGRSFDETFDPNSIQVVSAFQKAPFC